MVAVRMTVVVVVVMHPPLSPIVRQSSSVVAPEA
jgi:hypothetical protein